MAALFDRIWGREGRAASLMPPETLTALAHAGGQISAAYRDDQLVGATAAFIGLGDDGKVFLHSHVTGVLPGAAGRGVGRALKWHQRAWCLARQIERVQWTFDPLVRRNAVFNLVVLGARAVAYLEDVYGRVDDAINAGGPTDRLLVEWKLTAPRVQAAAEGRSAAPDADSLRQVGARTVLEVGDAETPIRSTSNAPQQLVQIPDDIEALRGRDPELAAAWSAAVRAALGGALAGGHHITGVTRDGWYVVGADRQLRELVGSR